MLTCSSSRSLEVVVAMAKRGGQVVSCVLLQMRQLLLNITVFRESVVFLYIQSATCQYSLYAAALFIRLYSTVLRCRSALGPHMFRRSRFAHRSAMLLYLCVHCRTCESGPHPAGCLVLAELCYSGRMGRR